MPKKTKLSKSQSAVVCVLIGTAIMLWQAYGFTRSLESKSWPVVSGTVKSAEMVRAGTRRQRRRRSVKPKISYSYTVKGEKFTSQRTEFGGMRLPWKYLHRLGVKHPLIKKYPKGSHVAVHYDPDSPAQATLSTRFPMSGMICFLAGAALAVAAIPTGEKESRKHSKDKKKKAKKKEKPLSDFRYPAHSGVKPKYGKRGTA